MKTWVREPSMPLFDLATTTGNNVRQTVIDATLLKAREVWKERYEAFILEYLAQHEDGTGEDIRLAYIADARNPRCDKEQASGGIFQKLSKAGRIVQVGFRKSKIFGNNLVVYRRGN